jgi:hypothetical protein
MNINRARGAAGEKFICANVPCPNCGRPLQLLPPGYPLYDVQCSGCVFRAQVKTNVSRHRDQVFGAGYSVLEHYIKSGQLIPPLLMYFRWKEGRRWRKQVHFFPFLTRRNIRPRTRSDSGSHPGYREFNYVGLADDNLPQALLFDE